MDILRMSIALEITGKAGVAAFAEVQGQQTDARKTKDNLRDRHACSNFDWGARAAWTVFSTPRTSRSLSWHDAAQNATRIRSVTCTTQIGYENWRVLVLIRLYQGGITAPIW